MSYAPYKPSESPSEPQDSREVTSGKISQRPCWLSSDRKALLALVVGLVLVSLILNVLVYTQPWSKIVVQIDNRTDGPLWVNMNIDISPRTSVRQIQTVGNNSSVDGTWEFKVPFGNHLLWVAAQGYDDAYFTLVKVDPLSKETVLILLTWYAIEGPW